MSRIMKKSIIFFVILTLAQAAYSEEKKVTVNLTAQEVAFSINIMNTIELRGNEVGPFIDIRNIIAQAFNEINKSKDKDIDIVFEVPVAKNFLYFLQRAKLKGEEAAIHYNITTKLVEVLKKAQ